MTGNGDGNGIGIGYKDGRSNLVVANRLLCFKSSNLRSHKYFLFYTYVLKFKYAAVQFSYYTHLHRLLLPTSAIYIFFFSSAREKK